MKRFYCVILAMLAVVLYAIVMSGCRAISSNVEVATQPVVETPLAEHIGKVRQGPFLLMMPRSLFAISQYCLKKNLPMIIP